MCGRWVRPTWYVPSPQRGRDETYRRCELVTLTFDRETGAQCSTCRGVPFCQFWRYYDYSLSIYGLLAWSRVDQMSVGRARRHRYQSMTRSKYFFCLDGRNWQITVFGDKILDLESDYRKLGSVTMLRSLIRILRASLVQIDTEMAEKYAKRYPNINQRYAVSSHSEDMPHDVCQH